MKVRKFEPGDLGQLSFCVEALDRDVKKPHERRSIGVLLCATKDDEVVEYALARTSSPTLVAEYQARRGKVERPDQKPLTLEVRAGGLEPCRDDTKL
jgi:hypothetical protein